MNKRLSDGDGGGSKPTFGAPSGLGSAGGFGAAKPGGFGGGLAFGSAAPAAAAPAAPGGGAAAAAPAVAAPDLNSTGLLPKIKAAVGDEKYKLFVGIVKQFKSGAIPLQQVNGQVGLMCAANPDLHAEFQKWSTQWSASQGQGAAAAAPAAGAQAAAPSAPAAGAKPALAGGFPAPSAAGTSTAKPAVGLSLSLGGAGAGAATGAAAAAGAGTAAAAGALSTQAAGATAVAAGGSGVETKDSATPSMAVTKSLLSGTILKDPMHSQTLEGLVDHNMHIAQFPYGSRPFGYLLGEQTASPGAGGQLPSSSGGAPGAASGSSSRHGDGGMGGGGQRGGVAGRRATNSASSVVSMQQQQQQQQQQSRNLKNPLAPSTKHQIMKGHSNQGVMSPPPLGSEPKMQQTMLSLHGGVVGCLDRKLMALELASDGTFASWRAGGNGAGPAPSPQGGVGSSAVGGGGSSQVGGITGGSDVNSSFTNEWDAWNDALVDLKVSAEKKAPSVFRTGQVIGDATKGKTQAAYLSKYAPATVRGIADDCAQSDKEVEEASKRVKSVETWEESGIESMSVLDAAIGQLDANERWLSKHCKGLGRACASASFASVPWIQVDQSTGTSSKLITASHAKLEALQARIKSCRGKLESSKGTLGEVLASRESIKAEKVLLRSMERAVRLNTERVQAGGLCQGLSGSGAEVWDMSGPHHIKASIPIKEKTEAITSFVKDAAPRLGKGVCETIVSHALIRSDVKSDGVDLLMELSKQLPDLIPTFVAICHARCAGSVPLHPTASIQAYAPKGSAAAAASASAGGEAGAAAGGGGGVCPLALPQSTKRDCARLPVEVANSSLTTGINAESTDLASSLGADGKEPMPDLQVMMLVAPFMQIGDEWVRLAKGAGGGGDSGGGAFKFVRGVLGSKPEPHDPGSQVRVHCMVPEGSTGVTEMMGLLMVRLCDDEAKSKNAWGIVEGVGAPKRSTQQRMYAWLAAAARLCGGPAIKDAERARIRYALQHMHAFLTSAGGTLVMAYPRSTAKVAALLLGNNGVVEAMGKLAQGGQLRDMLKVLCSGKDEVDRFKELAAMKAPAGGDAASLSLVDKLLDEDWPARSQEERDRLDKATSEIGMSVNSTCSDVDSKCRIISCLMRGMVDDAIFQRFETSGKCLRELLAGKQEQDAKLVLSLLQVKMAEHIITVAKIQPKMFSFSGGFQGFAWSAVLTKVASQPDGQLLVNMLIELMVSECPYIVATAEPSGRLSKGRGELKGIVNLFASLLQNEQLPVEVASHLAQTCIGPEAAQKIPALKIQPPGATAPMVNCASILLMWLEAFVSKPSVTAAVQAVAGGGADAASQLDELDRNAEYVRTVMAICVRIWDQAYAQARYNAGLKAVDATFEIRGKIVQLLRATFQPDAVKRLAQEGKVKGVEELIGLGKLVVALDYNPQTMTPNWGMEVEGGVDLMQSIGMATGSRTYQDIEHDTD